MKKFILFFCAAFIATLGMFAETVTLTYTAGVTGNLTGENDAATLGISASEWSVVSDKNGNDNHVGINKDGTIRLYTNNILTITNLKGRTITSVTLDLDSGEGEVQVNGQVVESDNNVFAVGTTEFVLTNPNKTQWRLKSITIDYEVPEGSAEVDFDKSTISAINQADFVEEGKWYLLKQKRGPNNTVLVSPVHDEGVGATMKRAAKDEVVVAGTAASDALDYLLRFIPTENEGAYNLQFANGHYWASTMTTTEEEPGEYNVYNINGEATHIGINLYNMDKIVDNDGAGATLAFWSNGEVTSLNGNNDWTVWEVEFVATSQTAAELKALVGEYEAVYNANNAAEVGEGIITSTDQFSSPYSAGSEEPNSSLDNLLDMDGSTYWHSSWASKVENHVHYLQVEFDDPISGAFELNMNRRVNEGGMCQNDNPVKMSVETSLDGEEFVLADEFDTPFTQTGAAPLVQATVNIPTPAKYLRFFNDGSNGGNDRGYWHCGDLQLKPIVTPAANATHAEAAAAFAEALAAAKAAGANATDADVAALQAAYETYVAALGTTPEPTPVTFKFTENEDGTITVTPSDLEATYFIHLSNASIDEAYEYSNKEESYNENVSYVTYNSEVHTGVTVFDPIQWMEDWYWGYFDYTPGEWWLMVGQVTVGEPTEEGAEISATKAGEPTVFTYNVVEPEPEVTFPVEGKAYVVFNNDAELYLNVVEHEAKATRLGAEPEKIFFTKKGEAWIIKDEDGNYVGGHSNTWNMASNVEQLWTIEEVEGGYAFKCDNGYIGFDKIVLNPDDELATAAYRNKNYATHHGVFTIFEYTFPLQHTAYKVKNVDAGYYMNISAADAKNTTIEKTPEEIFFTLAEDGGFYIQDKEGNYVGAGANDWTVANTVATWNVVEVEGGYAFQRTDAPTKHLGLDSVEESSAYYRDKGAANHYAHLIMLFDAPETTPLEDLQAAIAAAKAVTPEDYVAPADLFEDLAAEIAKAETLAGNTGASNADIFAEITALESAVKAVVEYVEPTYDELYDQLLSAVESAKTVLTDNGASYTLKGGLDYTKCRAGKPGYKPLEDVKAVGSLIDTYEIAIESVKQLEAEGTLTELDQTMTKGKALAMILTKNFTAAELRDEIVKLQHAVRTYQGADICIPEVGKTYIIRNHADRLGSGYEYLFTAGEEGRELIPYSTVENTLETRHAWTVSKHLFTVEDDYGNILSSEDRYVFTNVYSGQIFGYDGSTIGLCDSETNMNCWYFTTTQPRDIVAGSLPMPYGTLGLQFSNGSNKYRFATVNMIRESLDITGGEMPQHGLWSDSYASYFIFEEVEPATLVQSKKPEAVGIDTVLAGSNAQTYDLNGRRVAAPTKGLYIQNGKKVVR